MIRVLTDLNNVSRLEVAANSDSVLASGNQGMWVTLNSSDEAIYPAVGDALAFAVFNESELGSKSGVGLDTGGTGFGGNWSPDVENTKKVSLLYGKYRALTDQYDASGHGGTIALGSALTVNVSGCLMAIPATAVGSGYTTHAVAMKLHSNVVHRGVTYANVLEYVTV